MKRQGLIFIFLITISGLFTVRAEAEGKYAAVEYQEKAQVRPLFIFLDNSEFLHAGRFKLRPITAATFLAIQDKAFPIIVSGSCLYSLLIWTERRENQDTFHFYDSFNVSDWIIRKVRGYKEQKTDLYCMVPRDYLGILPPRIDQLDTEQPITELEYVLGLKIEHMDQVPDDSNEAIRNYFIGRYYQREDAFSLDQETGADFIKNLKSIFVLNAEYIAVHRAGVKRILFLEGHGQYNKSIATIPLVEFSLFLDFLEKIGVIFFVYSSCYAAGFNAQQVYGELTASAKTRTYSFTIVTQALTDAAIEGTHIEPEKRKVYYRLFVESMLRDSHDYKKALSYIMPSIKSPRLDIFAIPQIRAAHVPFWFPIVELEQAIIPISQTMAMTRKEPLVIKPYEIENEKGEIEKKDPVAILLYASRIPFSIHLMTKTVPTFISMVSGKAVHMVDGLYAPEIYTRSLISMLANAYAELPTYGDCKMVLFGKIQGKDDTITDVIIRDKIIYFTQWGTQRIYSFTSSGPLWKRTREGSFTDYKEGDYIKNNSLFCDNAAFEDEEKISRIRLLEKRISQMMREKQQRPQSSLHDELFFTYVKEGNIQEISLLIGKGVDINQTNSNHQTALMIAAHHGNAVLVEWLLQHGADATKRDLKWRDASAYARNTQHEQIAQYVENFITAQSEMAKTARFELALKEEDTDRSIVKRMADQNLLSYIKEIPESHQDLANRITKKLVGLITWAEQEPDVSHVRVRNYIEKEILGSMRRGKYVNFDDVDDDYQNAYLHIATRKNFPIEYQGRLLAFSGYELGYEIKDYVLHMVRYEKAIALLEQLFNYPAMQQNKWVRRNFRYLLENVSNPVYKDVFNDILKDLSAEDNAHAYELVKSIRRSWPFGADFRYQDIDINNKWGAIIFSALGDPKRFGFLN
jgi:hypothetical protein